MDHKNLTYKNFTSERAIRWHFLLKHYGPNIIDIKGPDNGELDALTMILINDSVVTDS